MAINYNRNILNSAVLAPVNAELEKIENALKDGLSLSGVTPNTPSSNIDMNNKRLFNLPPPINDTEPLRKGDADLPALQAYVQEAKDAEEAAEGYADDALDYRDQAEQFKDDAEAAAASIQLYNYITDAQELNQGNYELGASNTYTLPDTPVVGTTIVAQRMFGFTPVVATQGSNNMTYIDGSTDTTTTIDADFPVKFVWNGTTWEVK